MKNNENANVKDFNEAVKDNAQDVEVVEIQKKGILEKFKALKTWQKVLVIFLLTGTVAISVKVIYDLINKRPEAVAEAIEKVAQDGVEVVADVVA